jgi:hypothetical protein
MVWEIGRNKKGYMKKIRFQQLETTLKKYKYIKEKKKEIAKWELIEGK